MNVSTAFLSTPPPSNPPFPTGYGSFAPRPGGSSITIPARRRRHADLSLAFTNPLTRGSRKAYLGRVHVVGRQKLPNDVVEKHFGPLTRREVTYDEIDAAVTSVNKWYTDNGFPCSRLVPLDRPGFFRKMLVLYCIEPKLTAVHLVPVDKDNKPVEGGKLTTRRNVILRALDLKIGGLFEWRAGGFASLMAMGIFEYADAEVKQTSKDSVELTLSLRERPSCRVEPGAGMTSDGRVYGDISYLDNNFMGRGQRVHVEWQKKIDAGRSSGGITFEDFRIGAQLPLSFKIGAYRNSNSTRRVPTGRRSQPITSLTASGRTRLSENRYDESLRYEKDRDGLMMEIGYRPKKRHTFISFTPMIEHIIPNLVDQQRTNSMLQGVLQTSLEHITRLPIDLPDFGHSIRLEHSVGRVLTSNAEPFHKLLIRLTQYIKVGPKASIAMGSSISFGSENLPWHEQKSLGGPLNVRGYSYGELGRYKSSATGRIEFRVPLIKGQDADNLKPGSAKEASKGSESDDVDPDKEKSEAKNVVKAFENLPALVGVLFGDVAMSNLGDREVAGTSYGLGLRVGGIVTVDWVRTADGQKSKLHFGLVDRSL